MIRSATPEDLPSIRTLERHSDTAAHWAEREYDAIFSPEAPTRIALVALSEDETETQIIGFLIALCSTDEWEIENVVITAEERRRGRGSVLVWELIQKARIAGATSVLLEVRESNAGARRLYEKLGFREAGVRPDYYRDPADAAVLLKISISVP